MSDDVEHIVDEFLGKASSVYDEYQQGYVHADAALSMLESHVDSLRDAAAADDDVE